MRPLTIQYGAWSPDLQNYAVPVSPQQSVLPATPCADVLNVYYQDGAYRCLPAPVSTGSTLGSPCVSAFTFYDNVAGQEVVFAATANGIYAYTDGVPAQVAVENSATVTAGSWSLTGRLAGIVRAPSWAITSQMGQVSASGGVILTSTLTAALGSPYIGYASGATFGTTIGTLSPNTDSKGNKFTAMVTYAPSGSPVQFIVQISTSALPNNYFTKIVLGAHTLFTTNATVTGNAGLGPHFSQYAWSSPGFSLVPGTAYSVQVFS